MRSLLPLSLLLALPLIALHSHAASQAARSRPSLNTTFRVLDQDTGQPVAARIFVVPVGITRGKKKIIEDAETGTLSLRLPRGRYEISAMRGIEYTVDRREVALENGSPLIELRLRRVIDPGSWIASDLHTHSSQGFDSRVSVDQRLRSLATSGISFATPVEHNVVGFFPASTATRLGISWVPAMEVTPSAPSVGHFSIFPYAGETAPLVRGVGSKGLLTLLREKHPDALIQINHPRLNGSMGFFNVIRLDTKRGKNLAMLPPQIDTLEILNGIELLHNKGSEKTLNEWLQLLERGRTYWGTSGSDVHHKEQTPGYPRTYIRASTNASPREWVQALRQGHSFSTTGPFLELSQGDLIPGDTLIKDGDKVTVRLRLRAAPWVSVHQLELRSGGKIIWSKELVARPLIVGPPKPDAEAQRQEAILFDETVTVELPQGARALIAIARGDQPLNRVTPLDAFPSIAFTNPLLIPNKTEKSQPLR